MIINYRLTGLSVIIITALILFLLGLDFAPAQSRLRNETPNTAVSFVKAFDVVFKGPFSKSRAIHAKGVTAEGVFIPSAEAASLSRAPHFRTEVPVIVRFSSFSGDPRIPDASEKSSPRGMAIKFFLPGGGDTDIVAHSYNGFPAATGQDFLQFLQAVGSPDPAVKASYLSTHPAAMTYVKTPKPAPVSYASEEFFGVNAFRFTNAENVSQFGRYRIEPHDEIAHLSAIEAKDRSPNYLSEELDRRLARSSVTYDLLVQIAGPGDAVTNATIPWTRSGAPIRIGIIRLTKMHSDQKEGDSFFFTPLNLVKGIAPSGDPLLKSRGASYDLSRERRSH